MNTRSKFSVAISAGRRIAGSNECASTPFSNKAFKTPSPDSNDISRSAERPPMRTPTRPNCLGLMAAKSLATCSPQWDWSLAMLQLHNCMG